MGGRHLRLNRVTIAALMGLAAGGCTSGDGLPRQPVSGSVTLDGQDLKDGVIFFFPAVRVVSGILVVGSATIKDGRFSIARDVGVIPGKYLIAVHAGGGRDAARKAERDPETAAVATKELIPSKFNSETVLEIEINAHAIKQVKINLTSR